MARETILIARVRDLSGALLSTPTNVRFVVSNPQPFNNGNDVVAAFSRSQNFDSSSEMQLSVVESETVAKNYKMEIIYNDGVTDQRTVIRPTPVTDTVMEPLGFVCESDDYQL